MPKQFNTVTIENELETLLNYSKFILMDASD